MGYSRYGSSGKGLSDSAGKAFRSVKKAVQGMTGGRVTGDTGISAFAFAGKYQYAGVSPSGEKLYTPRIGGGGTGIPAGGISLADMAGLAAKSSQLNRVKPNRAVVGGAGMPITTGYGAGLPQGLAHGFKGIFGGGGGGVIPADDEGKGSSVMGLAAMGGLAYIAYKVLIA